MLVEAVRSMLIDANLPHTFWAEALSTAVYLKNHSPTKAVKDMTPFEAWKNMRPKIGHLRVFGCDAFAHIPKNERHKLDAKPEKAYSLDMEKKLRAINSMIPQKAKSFTVEISGSMKQSQKRYKNLPTLTQSFSWN